LKYWIRKNNDARCRMKTLLINYADRAFVESQKLNAHSGLEIGGIDRAIKYGRSDIDQEFYRRNQSMLDEPRGAGYWLWKPYLVAKALKEEMANGDVLFYCDSGGFFVAPVAPVIDLCLSHSEKPVLLFALAPTYMNRRYTKRDCFYYMDLDREPYLSL